MLSGVAITSVITLLLSTPSLILPKTTELYDQRYANIHIMSVQEFVQSVYREQRKKELAELRAKLEQQRKEEEARKEELRQEEEAMKVPAEVAGGYFIAVDKSDFTLYLYNNAKLVKSYPIEIGAHTPDSETPEGKFRIITKVEDPTYNVVSNTDGKMTVQSTVPGGDPKNPLGPRWLGLNAGIHSVNSIGIHGVTTTLTIGHASSDGCVRLKNDDITELYSIVQAGTQVWIGNRDSLVSMGVKLNN